MSKVGLNNRSLLGIGIDLQICELHRNRFWTHCMSLNVRDFTLNSELALFNQYFQVCTRSFILNLEQENGRNPEI